MVGYLTDQTAEVMLTGCCGELVFSADEDCETLQTAVFICVLLYKHTLVSGLHEKICNLLHHLLRPRKVKLMKTDLWKKSSPKCRYIPGHLFGEKPFGDSQCVPVRYATLFNPETTNLVFSRPCFVN